MPETRTFDLATLVIPALPATDHATPDAGRWQSAVTASLSEAEQVLDSSERKGHRERQLVVCTPDWFVVRWR